MMYVVKKDGTKEDFDVQKIVRAVNKSASRIMYKFKEDEVEFICSYAQEKAGSLEKEEISIQDMHNIGKSQSVCCQELQRLSEL